MNNGKTENFKPRLRSYCAESTRIFLQESSLHGLKYVGDKKLTYCERIFFALSFCVACVIAAVLIMNIYEKWESTPVIIGLSSKPTSIREVPFPSVTVCPMNQVNKGKVLKFKQNSPEYGMLQMLCHREVNFSAYQHMNFSSNSFSNFIKENSQTCEHMIIACKIASAVYNCSDLFRPVLTDEGMCCTFNRAHPKFLYKGKHGFSFWKEHIPGDGSVPVDWNPEHGYRQKLPKRYYPRVASGTGVSRGLTLLLNAEMEEYFCSTTSGPGFKVSLHNAIAIPYVRDSGISIQLGYETRIRLEAISSEASPSIRSIDKSYRQCLFHDEQDLQFYRYYTRRNCEMECEARTVLEQCNCIPYNMPLLYENASVCSLNDFGCVKKMEKRSRKSSRFQNECSQICIANCYDLKYSSSVFAAPFSMGQYQIQDQYLQNMSTEFIHKNLAMVHFFYKENIFRGSCKTSYVGLTEFLSSTGGIMGLLMGFSVISVVEIFHFTFLRPMINLLRLRRSKARESKNDHTLHKIVKKCRLREPMAECNNPNT